MSDTSPKPAVAAHVLPFVAWLLFMLLPGNAAWMYAARSLVCLIIFACLRPWRWYSAPPWSSLVPALLTGIGVYGLWVLPETAWFGRLFPSGQQFYLRYALDLWHPGKLPAPVESTPYAPAVCGWPLTIIRLLGSGLVIAAIEEFFWRGFLYRYVIDSDFLAVKPDLFKWGQFLLVAALFGLEHDRWVVGFLAGAAYGVLVIRTRSLWPAVFAHCLTNLLLGAHVIGNGAYQFW